MLRAGEIGFPRESTSNGYLIPTSHPGREKLCMCGTTNDNGILKSRLLAKKVWMAREKETDKARSPGNVPGQENGAWKDMMGGLGAEDPAGADFQCTLEQVG